MGSLFGGGSKSSGSSTQQSTSSSSSDSHNQAYPWLQQTYGGMGATGVGANDAIANLLGIGNNPAAGAAAFDAYKNSAGYQSALTSGTDAIMGNKAAGGLLQSGSALKGVSRFGSDLASQYYDKYLNNLLGLSNQGLQAGSLISGAGGVSTSQSNSQSSGTSTNKSSSKGGLGTGAGSIGSTLLGGVLSDPRLKLDVVKVGENEGLGVYNFRYVWDEPEMIRTGYMADEVKALRPDALGPTLPGGYMTVNYTALPTIH